MQNVSGTNFFLKGRITFTGGMIKMIVATFIIEYKQQMN